MVKSNDKYYTLTKRELQLFKSLKSVHGRKKNNAFVVEAVKNVEELLTTNVPVSTLYVSSNLPQSKIDNFKSHCWHKNIQFALLQDFDFQKITTMQNPEGVLALCELSESETLNAETLEFPALYLSEVNDPGNLGTIFRTAAWYGVSSIILSENSVDIINPKVIRSSMGSIFHLKIFQNVNEADFVLFADKNSIPIYAADLQGKNPLGMELPEKYILCFGSESHGVTERIINNSKEIISIPKFGSGESLNLAISVGIILNSIFNKG